MSSHAFAAGSPRAFRWAMKKGPRGRHEWHDRGFGPMPHMGFGPPGGPPFGPRGRKRRGDVRVALLLVLAEEPRNGYQLMQEIEDRSGGRWRPSPGSVYPALAQLEDEGFVRATERDGAKLFEITDSGRAHLEERNQEHAPWELADDPEFRSISDLRALLKQVAIATMQVGQAGSERQVERAGELLTDTRRRLYRILAEEEPEA